MKRFRPERPADVCFARGTFNAHPYVMGGMNAFLRRLETPEIQALYENQDAKWNARAKRFNDTMAAQGFPVRAANLQSIWTFTYSEPGRYHWMLQYFLRWHGLALSWVGTGRVIFGLNLHDEDFEEVLRRFVAAAQDMKEQGWWWASPQLTHKAIRRQVLREMWRHLVR